MGLNNAAGALARFVGGRFFCAWIGGAFLGGFFMLPLGRRGRFLGRLEDAIRQQQRVVDQARVAAEASGSAWRERKIESASLGKVVTRLQVQERIVTDRRDQAATDERAAMCLPVRPD